MATELRKTGISIVGDIPWGTHFCYFYETKQDLLDILIPYFKIGLENNEFCLWIISNSGLLTMQEATSALREALPDLDRYLAEGSIEVVAHDEWFLYEGAFDFHMVTIALSREHEFDCIAFLIHGAVKVFTRLPDFDAGLIHSVRSAAHLQMLNAASRI